MTQTNFTPKSSPSEIEKIAIIGAGPGGLAAAIALGNLGFNVQVYEKAQEFRPAGTGLGLAPNGLNFLDAIAPGIVESLTVSGCEVHNAVVKSQSGETIQANPIRHLEQYGRPLLTVWWWRLQQTLAARLPANIIHLNHRCIGFAQDDTGVQIHFEGGKTVTADLLIGADGVNSVVREVLFGEGKPNYLGSLCWRSVLEYRHELFDDYELVFVKGNQQFMYILNVGGGYTSWISRKFMPEYSVSPTPDEAKSRILQELADWDKSFRAIVAATPAEQIWEGPICDRPPLPHWSLGRVTLLGDAAHPMAPALGQGANTTFEDVYELSQAFAQSSSLAAALTSYEQRRIERTKIIQARSALGEMGYYDLDADHALRQMMRFYATDAEIAARKISERSQLTQEDFRDWLYTYKPSVTC